MSKDFKTLKMLSFFLALFIINKIWMHYQKRCSTLYPSIGGNQFRRSRFFFLIAACT